MISLDPFGLQTTASINICMNVPYVVTTENVLKKRPKGSAISSVVRIERFTLVQA